jgi:hypothetical protein
MSSQLKSLQMARRIKLKLIARPVMKDIVPAHLKISLLVVTAMKEALTMR